MWKRSEAAKQPFLYWTEKIQFFPVSIVKRTPPVAASQQSIVSGEVWFSIHVSTWAYSRLLRTIIARNGLPFLKIFSNFVHFCPNFQIFCPFLPFFWKIARIPILSRIDSEYLTDLLSTVFEMSRIDMLKLSF